MLVVVYKQTDNSTVYDVTESTWHVGEKFPILYHGIRRVQEIQADGDELNAITRRLEGIPYSLRTAVDGNFSHSRVQRWFGDFAKQIAAALQADYPS